MKPTNLQNKNEVPLTEELDLYKLGGFQGFSLREKPEKVYKAAFYWPSSPESHCGKMGVDHIMFREGPMKTLCLRPGCNAFT